MTKRDLTTDGVQERRGAGELEGHPGQRGWRCLAFPPSDH